MASKLPDNPSLDELVRAMYDAISFEEGEEPDWETDRKIFAPDARLVRLSASSTESFTLDDYIENVKGLIRSGELPSFHEIEIARREEAYGDIAHLWSSYEGRRSPSDPELVTRGINSIQAIRRDGRWRIVSMTWFREDSDHPIPEQYL